MSHTKGLAEVKELPCSKGGTMKFLLVSGTGIAVMCGKVGGAKVEEGNALRIAALWNMAERLGLSTEEIESGNVETTLKAAPDMLAVLEKLSSLLVDGEEYVPLELREELTTAIQKARGEV